MDADTGLITSDIYKLSVDILERNQIKIQIQQQLLRKSKSEEDLRGVNTAKFESCDFQTPRICTPLIFTLENAIGIEREANMYVKRKIKNMKSNKSKTFLLKGGSR